MSPNGEYQEKMTESLYNAKFRFDLDDYDVLSYLKTHMTTREPHEILTGYLSENHVQQLMSVREDVSDYSGGYSTRYIPPMVEALCVEGGTSQEVNIDAQMVHINWNEISNQYYDLEDSELRTEYARVREIARNNREDHFDLIVKQDLINELNL